MRVLVDGYWWAEGPLSNRQVQREIVRHWVDLFDDELTMVVPHKALDGIDAPRGVRCVGTRLWPHGVASVVDYPRIARRVGADVSVVHNFTPWTGRSAVFVHDVMFQTNPEWFTLPERAYLRLVPWTLRRADVVATSSHHEAERIAAHNRGIAPVVPIGLAVGTELATARPTRPAGVDVEEFVLSVGRLNVRKNLGRLFTAAARSGVITPTRPLLVVGEPEGARADLGPDVRDAVTSGAIRFLGRVDDGELAWLYGHADLFVYLSLDEGFGLPPVEALSFGCPALVSDIPVMRENLGASSAYVDPLDVDAIAAALQAPPVAPTFAAPDWADVTRRLRAAVVSALAPQLA
ncbi:glycosyltransferase family 1 protein [uncultured Cellulomonas sp.]|uniref:glycosyltransferase family 4 protein n=1 Tax=uncultured Cellulomonas sp. TaxID=189682 RepID=UPI0028EB3650|nr:glycosyltransferase family 1 protein [uncultured Cellulomonas sp.]